MAAAPAKQLTQLFGTFAGHADLTDAELLRRFVAGRDEAAFAALVGRHGPLVLGVCRRVLGEDHAAEDAFQATFLLLARKSARLTRDGSLAGWLFAAARRTAGQARRAEQRRRRREAVAARPDTAPADDRAWREVRQVLDAELARLPERHRTPLILCYLNGLTQAEAARQLGWGETTLRGRLEYGRQVLRRRLARLGLPLAALLVPAAPAPVSAALRAETLATALTHNPLPPAVAALAGNPTRWRTAAVSLLAALCVGLAATAFSLPPQQPPSPPADAPVAAAQTKVDLLGDPLPPDALRRLGTLRHRHLWLWYTPKQPLPDGKTVLTATDQDVLWVDMTTGKLADSWPLPKRHQCRGLSPDGRLALLFDESVMRAMSLWDLSTRKRVRVLRHQGSYSTPTEAFFSPDGKLLAIHSGTGHLPGLARVFEIATGRELWRDGNPGDPNRGFWPLGFLGDGKTLAGLDVPGNALQVRDRETGKVLRSFATLKRDRMLSYLLAPDGKTLFLGEFGDKIRAWDVATGKELPPLKGEHGTRIAVSRDGKTVLTGGTAPELWVWDWPAAKVRKRIPLAGDAPQALTVSADGKRAEVLLLGETALRFYDLETGQESPPPTEAHRGPANAVTVTPDGRVFSAGTDGTFREWDLQTGRHLRRSPGWQRFDHPILVPSTGHPLLAMAHPLKGDVLLREWRTGGVARHIATGANSVQGMALSPDGRRLAVGGFHVDPRTGQSVPCVTLWDVARGQQEWRLPGATVRVLAFSPDGGRLAGFNLFRGLAVHLWEAATGKERATLPQKHVDALAFTSDGRALACGDIQGVTLWEVATGKQRGRIEASADGNALCPSPDGRWLARAKGRVVHLYDVRRLRRAHTFRGHDGDVNGLAFTPDGRALVSASADTTLLVWDVAGVAKRLASPARPDAAALEAAWKNLAAADAKAAYRAVRLLADAPGQSLPLLRERLRPVSPPDAEKMARLLAGLGSDRFGERTQAAEELEQLGEQAEGPLRRLLAGKPPLEVARRVEGILARLEGPLTDPERLRQIRAVEVLEGIGNAERGRLLQTLAAGHAEARQTREAAAALAASAAGREPVRAPFVRNSHLFWRAGAVRPLMASPDQGPHGPRSPKQTPLISGRGGRS